MRSAEWSLRTSIFMGRFSPPASRITPASVVDPVSTGRSGHHRPSGTIRSNSRWPRAPTRNRAAPSRAWTSAPPIRLSTTVLSPVSGSTSLPSASPSESKAVRASRSPSQQTICSVASWWVSIG